MLNRNMMAAAAAVAVTGMMPSLVEAQSTTTENPATTNTNSQSPTTMGQGTMNQGSMSPGMMGQGMGMGMGMMNPPMPTTDAEYGQYVAWAARNMNGVDYYRLRSMLQRMPWNEERALIRGIANSVGQVYARRDQFLAQHFGSMNNMAYSSSGMAAERMSDPGTMTNPGNMGTQGTTTNPGTMGTQGTTTNPGTMGTQGTTTPGTMGNQTSTQGWVTEILNRQPQPFVDRSYYGRIPYEPDRTDGGVAMQMTPEQNARAMQMRMMGMNMPAFISYDQAIRMLTMNLSSTEASTLRAWWMTRASEGEKDVIVRVLRGSLRALEGPFYASVYARPMHTSVSASTR